MGASRPLQAALFIYESLRLLLLVAFLFIVQSAGGNFAGEGGAFFPYIVYISSNALFFLMALFMWLRPEEYRNYVTLYMAGKIIAVASFYVWAISTSREITGMHNLAGSIVLFGGSALVNLADVLSVWGAWTLQRKYRRMENGGL